MAGNLVVIAAQNNIESVAFIFDLAAHEMTFLVSDFATERFVPAETFPVVETIGRPSGQARCQGNIYCSIEARIAVGAHRWEERRVGQGGVSTCRYRWGADQ